MKRALVSVTDKTGVVDFCKGLVGLGYEIISTGGTKKVLDEAGVKTLGISEVTGFPEILDGRVKTLHPNVHGGLLAVRDNKNHVEQLKEHNVEMLYKENDKITNMEIINWEKNNKEKFIPKDLSNYKNILQSHNKVKPIIKEFNKNEILINPNYIWDVDYLIDETNINDSSNID